MIVQATRLRSWESVEETLSDLIGFAGADCLVGVDIILWDVNDKKLRAAKFMVSISATGWVNQRPGNNLWPQTPGGRLQIVATLNEKWWALSSEEKNRLREVWGIKGLWSPTDIDLSHSDLAAKFDRKYASHGYGLTKTLYQ
jgi:hypothetical protein